MITHSRSIIFLFFASLLSTTLVADSQTPNQSKCNLQSGDSLEKVKEFLRITDDPEPIKDSTSDYPGKAAYQYKLSQRGIWIFFDRVPRVSMLRFDKPFSGSVYGIRIGYSRDQLDALFGKPVEEFDSFPDTEALAFREQRKQELLDRLPDPVPKKTLFAVFDQIDKIDREPFPQLKALVYLVSPHERLRVDISPRDRRIRMIFAWTGACWAD